MSVNTIVELPSAQAPPIGNPEAPVETIPSYIEVRYWPEDDGSWGGHSPLLGVSATADSQPELFGEMVEQVEEFWQILNDKYPTLSDELQLLLKLRGLGLRFEKQA